MFGYFLRKNNVGCVSAAHPTLFYPPLNILLKRKCDNYENEHIE